jgi:hypothetical protein
MGAQVTFVYADWAAAYPEFATTVTAPLANAYFAEATIYHRNDGSGPVTDPAVQLILLWMLVAHIAQLRVGSTQQAVSPLVGRLSSASEGSVSATADNGSVPGTAAWFVQTKYGNSYWGATAQYRMAHYRSDPRRNFNPWPGVGC